jgi:hypothetical protein
MLASEKLAPQRVRPVDKPFLVLRPRILTSFDTGETTMASFKILAAAALLSAMTLTPVFAQAAIQEPGLFAFYHPNADVLNGGAPTPEAALASAPPAASEAMQRWKAATQLSAPSVIAPTIPRPTPSLAMTVAGIDAGDAGHNDDAVAWRA